MIYLVALLALAVEQPAPQAPAPQPATAAEADFAAALAADQKAAQPAAPPPPPAASPSSQALLNPETSVILTTSAGIGRNEEPARFTAGDDAPVDSATIQEVEVTFAAAVDPYFNARLFLAIPHLEGIEVEEGYLITTALPANLQVKAGIFRSAFGRNNEQHLHLQDFARRPLTTALLGDDGLRAPGAQVSLLLPLPWYVLLWAEGFVLTPRRASAAFGLEQFFELGPAWSLMLAVSGASLALGAGEAVADVGPPGLPRPTLAGGDLYLKWRPVNETQTYAWVAFTGEYIAARRTDVSAGPRWNGAGYAQVVAQVARRWRVGVRTDLDGIPHPAMATRGLLASTSLTFLPTEFSRVRFTYQHQRVAQASDRQNDFFFLQLEGTIGAHGAHPF